MPKGLFPFGLESTGVYRSDPTRFVKRFGCVAVMSVLIGIAFVGGIVYVSCSNFFANLMGEKTYKITGDNRKFDPFAKLGEVRSHLPKNARLIKIEATFVRSDGTMDLEAKYVPFPRATYTFQVPLDGPPENAPPIGAGRSPDDVWFREVEVECYQPGQRRMVSRTGGGVNTKYQYTHLGMEVDEKSPESGKLDEEIGDPKCSTQRLWKLGLEKGARADAVARIEYDKQGYEFTILDLDVRFRCDADCGLKG